MMRNRGLACISLILGCTMALVQPGVAGSHSNRSLRSLLAATAIPQPSAPQFDQGWAAVANNWNAPPPRLAMIEEALGSFDFSNGNFFMHGDRANGGMALALGHATYPGRGYTLDLRWQLDR